VVRRGFGTGPVDRRWCGKVDYESRTLGLDRNELGAFLVHAGPIGRTSPWSSSSHNLVEVRGRTPLQSHTRAAG
jgi:hypothetical protein